MRCCAGWFGLFICTLNACLLFEVGGYCCLFTRAGLVLGLVVACLVLGCFTGVVCICVNSVGCSDDVSFGDFGGGFVL